MNNVKRLSCAAMAVVISAAATMSASAESQSATLHAVVDDTFSISIPEVIEVGEYSTVTATSVNVAEGKQVNVAVMFDAENAVTIHNTVDNSETITVSFNNQNGEMVTSLNPVLVSFENSKALQTADFYSYISNSENAKAGEYTGSVMFSIECE